MSRTILNYFWVISFGTPITTVPKEFGTKKKAAWKMSNHKHNQAASPTPRPS
jgi:hypothetical protein